MLIKEEADRRRDEEEVNPYSWPQSYYMEEDGEKRRELLDQELALHPDDPDDQLRLELWEIRYERLKNGMLSDQYMRRLIDLVQISRELNKMFGKKTQRKTALDAVNFLCNDRIEHFGLELVTAELKHLLLTYGMMCLDDKSYGTHLWGLLRLSESAIADKLELDFLDFGERLPESLDLVEEFSVFSDVVKQASRYLGLR